MGNENLMPPELPSVPEMLRVTGTNNAAFMEQIALHIEKLESEVIKLRQRVAELEVGQNVTK